MLSVIMLLINPPSYPGPTLPTTFIIKLYVHMCVFTRAERESANIFLTLIKAGQVLENYLSS